jgi:hypothetical protein
MIYYSPECHLSSSTLVKLFSGPTGLPGKIEFQSKADSMPYVTVELKRIQY